LMVYAELNIFLRCYPAKYGISSVVSRIVFSPIDSGRLSL
jgi:hypothetical protein